MNILGLSPFMENPAACLVREGRMRAFCQEERLTRLKGSHGQFPSRAVAWCLRSEGLSLGDVDRIAVAWDCRKYPWKMLRHLVRARVRVWTTGAGSPAAASDGAGAALRYLLRHTPAAFEQGIRDQLRHDGHRGPIPRIVFTPHHEAHALQAFFQSPFGEAAVLVVDGSGEENAVSAFHFGARGRRLLFRVEVPQSLGWYYGAFTAYLGFHPSRDEGKLMGLAAFGETRRESNPWMRRLDRVLRVTDTGFELDPTFLKFSGHAHHPRFGDKLRNFIVSHDARLEPIAPGDMAGSGGMAQPRCLLPEYVDLAFAVQDRLEEALVSVARRVRRESGSARLCLAGGVALNCKANARILAEGGFDQLFVHPAASDDGAALGAALHTAEAEDRVVADPLRHAQWGPAYSDANIAAVLRTCGVPFTQPPDIAEASAALLAEGCLLGWFQGALEMGPRALGGRSIIAAPRNDAKARLNAQVKFREAWRPYGPSIAHEAAPRYARGAADAPFMALACSATPELSGDVVHVDGTTRPQTVRPDILPLWHRLLLAVEGRTGHPVVLNTSFNVRGEPIVCTPQDAIRCFYGSGLEALAIGGFLVRKAGASTA